MDPNEKDKRTCKRFSIEGAALSYKKMKIFPFVSGRGEKNCPILDLSRGGCRFLTQNPIKADTSVFVEIALPEEEEPLFFYGETRWLLPHPGLSYNFEVGIQFNAYGEDGRQNALSNLERIKKLELKYSDDTAI